VALRACPAFSALFDGTLADINNIKYKKKNVESMSLTCEQKQTIFHLFSPCHKQDFGIQQQETGIMAVKSA